MRMNLRGVCLAAFRFCFSPAARIGILARRSDRYREDFHYSYPLNPGGERASRQLQRIGRNLWLG